MDHGVLFRLSAPGAFAPVAGRARHWVPLDAMLGVLLALFATPALLLRRGFAGAEIAAAFLMQIQKAERSARVAILRDALALAAGLAALSPRRGAARRAARCGVHELGDDFRAWRAGFRFRAGPRGASSRRRGPPRRLAEPDFYRMLAPWPPQGGGEKAELAIEISIRACALRFEALRRVVENPAPFAARLARRLRGPEGPSLTRRLRRLRSMTTRRPARRRRCQAHFSSQVKRAQCCACLRRFRRRASPRLNYPRKDSLSRNAPLVRAAHNPIPRCIS